MPAIDHHKTQRTTVALKKATKAKLDSNRAPGQCYDGFISQLVDMWEGSSRKGSARPAKKSS